MKPELRRGLWGLLLAGLVCALLVLGDRAQRETRDPHVEPVLDYVSVRDLARAEGVEGPEERKKFAAWGVKSYALSELRLDDLQTLGIATLYDGLQLSVTLKMAGTQGAAPDPRKMYLVFFKPDWIPQVQDSLSLALGPHKVGRWSNDTPWPILEVDTDLRTLQALGFGFSEELFKTLLAEGYRVWLRPENKAYCADTDVDAYFQHWQGLKEAQGVIFGGALNEAVGYPQGLDVTARHLTELGWKLGIIELAQNAQQKGIEALARALPEQAVRVFAIPPAQQDKLKPPQVVGMYSLAARERNLRVLYLRPYAWDPSPDKGWEDGNRVLFEGIQKDLASLYGEAHPFPPQPRHAPLLLAVVAAGAGAASWLLLEAILPVPAALGVLLVLGLALGTAATCLVNFQLWRSLMALGTAFAVSSLALVSHFERLEEAGRKDSPREVLGASLILLARVSLFTLGGALMAASFLGETSYLLGLDIFRGVKLVTFGVPALVTLLWLKRTGVIRSWLSSPLSLYHLIGLGTLALLAVIYWLRTGNMAADTGGEALEYEKVLRLLLDRTLHVRPRFKEFLLGHPGLFLCPTLLYLGRKEWVWLGLLAGAVGQAGLADTFGHTHTPLLISLIRCALGVLLGGLVGWVAASLALWLVPRKDRVEP